MAGLEELQTKLQEIVQGDRYIDPATDIADPATPKDFHYETLQAWQALKVSKDQPDLPLPLLLRDREAAQVRYGGDPEKDIGVGSYILDVEEGQHYQLQGSDSGYTLEPVTNEHIESIRGNAPSGTKLILLEQGERFALNVEGGEPEVYHFTPDTGGNKLTHWRDQEPKYYDPEQAKVSVAVFGVEGVQAGQSEQYFLMHNPDGGYSALSREGFLEFVKQYPELGAKQLQSAIDEPLTREEFSRLPEIGIALPDPRDVAADYVIDVPSEPDVGRLNTSVDPVLPEEPEVSQLGDGEPTLSDTAVMRGGDVIRLPEGEEPQQGDMVVKDGVPEVEEETLDPIGLVLSRHDIIVPSEAEMSSQRMVAEGTLYEGARNVFYSLQANGSVPELLERFDEVVEVFQGLEGEKNSYSDLLKDARDALYDDEGVWREDADWPAINTLASELDQMYASRVAAVANPAAETEAAPTPAAAPLPAPGR